MKTGPKRQEQSWKAADIHLLVAFLWPPQAALAWETVFHPSLLPGLKGKAVSLFPTFLGT